MEKLNHILCAALCGIFFFTSIQAQMIDVQGHRGCRGLMPENTVAAFLRALDLGVTTLEMDAVISKDGKVVVSHEPFLSHVICRGPEGFIVEEEEETDYNLYEMTYDEIEECDCGSRLHPRFPEQRKLNVSKPLLSEVIREVEAYIRENQLNEVQYNIETKSSPKGDGVYHPAPPEFVDLIMAVIENAGIEERTILQSFDIRTLQYSHKAYPNIRLALLVENAKSMESNLERLGFTPDIYSPYFRLLKKNTIEKAQAQGMKVIPWTVNKPRDIKRMMSWQVDGIISDYPDRVIEALNK